jgi:thiol-disulfide isomerase/thioredoxin
MKIRTGILSFIIVTAFIGSVAIVSLATRSPKTSEAVAEVASTGGASEVATAGASVGVPSVEEAYQTLTAKLEVLQQDAQKARSTETRIEVLQDMDLLLSEFIDSYPDTPEAYNVMFDAGMVSFTLQKPKKAIRRLESFLQNSVDAPRDKQAYAHYYLAEAYKQEGKYDDAEAEYKTVLNRFGDIDRRLSSAVQQSLAMLNSDRKLKIGGEPIPFDVTSLKGQKLSPEVFKGKVLLLDFWATWCAPCRQEMPNVIKVYDKYNDKGFEIVGISLDRDRKDLDRYIDKYNIDWHQYFDGKYWQNEVATKYGVSSIPATFLIDKKGKIRYKSLRGSQLETAVKELLAE